MADNFNATAGDGTVVGAADDIGGVKYPRVKATWGPDGTANDTDVATGKPMPVQLRGSDGTDRSNLLPVSGTVTANLGTIGGAATADKQPALGTAGTASTDVITIQGIASGTVVPIAAASGAIASGAVASGALASGAVASGAFASGALASGSVADGAMVTLGAKADAKSTATDTTSVTIMQVLKQVSASVQLMVFGAGTAAASQRTTLASDDPAVAALGATTGAKVVTDANGTIQQYLRGLVTFFANSLGAGVASGAQRTVIATDQTWNTGMSPRAFSAAATTLTRPANTTAYTAGDSISDNATAGSVTALSATLGDVNDDLLTITEVKVTSTDTGLAGKKLRAYLFNSDPTASSGVGAGDNAAYSQKVAGYVGSLMGWMETGFSDGTVGRLVPTFNETNNTQAGGFIVCKPTSGAKTLYIQFQAVEAFTPSANSTTIIAMIKGFQARAS